MPLSSLPRTVLVTGAAGFIGAHAAVALLARGDRVIGIDNLNAYYDPALKHARLAQLIGPHPAFRFVHADFADPAALAAALDGEVPTHILHLGAQAGVRYSLEAPMSYAHSNLTGQLTLLEVARAHGVAHMVYASSSSVYGNSSPLPFDADQPADRPVSLYAATKRSAELLAESYAHLYHIPLTGLRFFTVYGPWGRPDMALWRFTERLLRGESLPLYNSGRMRRDFTFIADIVAGTLAALDHPPADDGTLKPGGLATPHALYNLGNDTPEALGTLIDILAEATGKTPVLDNLPMQPGDVEATWANIAPARQNLGYAPTTSLADGIPAFVRWFKAYHAGA
ncbi:UDP-glucuronate 4-epimerase [Polymorphobacter multimanifer]|uniref:UDP-glucuronate 4-epimerase n=1 Tax=Polymorphobacter multimanifer TaxID=1070431 RepID=A0A841LCJ7_9SPHN|nr:NAD-dependent epimerase/dehydratase family protein [Polymorphobacter multimanifer]MBB6226708.1 UDP-glucuronate 4-epimerase [Polymorphobacter multimanifer]